LLLAGLCPRRLGAEYGDSVLLTFDDGPHSRITPAVLDRLAAYDTRAIFFVVGRRIAAAPALLRRIEGAGHVIGNHSFRHERGKHLGFRGYRADLRRCQHAIHAETGQFPVLFRPPFGERSPTTLLAARSLGLSPVTWSLDAEDWRCRTAAEAVPTAERLVQAVRPRDVVLLHDDHEGVLTILDRLLPVLQERGLDLASGVDWRIRAA
jgi:peptidoglycan/xylan/chitin deacetylase (PgdA/CDA1 family)